MKLIRPRITDYYNLLLSQEQLDFAIPFLEEDIPLFVDPFLLWKSPSQQDQALHTSLVNSFNNLNYLLKKGDENQAITNLILASECNEVGLGLSKRRKGAHISREKAIEVLTLFTKIPEYSQFGFAHFEEIQLYVEGIAKDRVSDITCNFLKSFLIDFTVEQCQITGIPIERTSVPTLYDYRKNSFLSDVEVELPVNPNTKTPLIFVPRRWLRFNPWINFEEYYRNYCPNDESINPNAPDSRVKVLLFNRENYGVVRQYVEFKIKTFDECKNDPLFKQIPVLSAKRQFLTIKRLPSGKTDNADKKYEDTICQLLASLLYPHLDFAQEQSRTDSGVLIRDLIFYNNKSVDFLNEIYQDYGNRQLIMELKNVAKIEREHINQLNRYLDTGLGKFGVIVTRNPLPRAMFQNTIDLWSGQRKCIIALTDQDIELMVNVFETKQRTPVEVLKSKYIEFRRACPS